MTAATTNPAAAATIAAATINPAAAAAVVVAVADCTCPASSLPLPIAVLPWLLTCVGEGGHDLAQGQLLLGGVAHELDGDVSAPGQLAATAGEGIGSAW